MTTGVTLDGEAAPPTRRPVAARLRRETFVLFGGCALLAALGVALAYVWAAVAPRVQIRLLGAPVAPRTDRSYELVDATAQGFFTYDVAFVSCAAVLGLLLGVTAWLLLRRLHGAVAVVASLAIGGWLAGLVAREVGRRIGRSHFLELASVGPAGQLLNAPVRLRSTSALLVLPFVAVFVLLLLNLVNNRWEPLAAGAPGGTDADPPAAGGGGGSDTTATAPSAHPSMHPDAGPSMHPDASALPSPPERAVELPWWSGALRRLGHHRHGPGVGPPDDGTGT